MKHKIPVLSHIKSGKCSIVILNYNSIDSLKPPAKLLVNVHFAVIDCRIEYFTILENTYVASYYECTAKLKPISEVPEWAEGDEFDCVPIDSMSTDSFYRTPRIEDYM